MMIGLRPSPKGQYLRFFPIGHRSVETIPSRILHLRFRMTYTYKGGHMPKYYVYIMNSTSGTLYTGITNDLMRRVYQHKRGEIPGFTRKYKVTRLAYFEETGDVYQAIAREKEIKGWRRSKKIDLIRSLNPNWEDLAAEWFDEMDG